MQMSVHAYRVAEPRTKCRDFFSCFSCWVKRVGRSGRVDSRSLMTVGCTPLHSVLTSEPGTVLMPTQVGISWWEAGNVTRRFLAAQELCSRVLWEGALGVDLYPLLGYKFLGLMKKESRAAVSMIPHTSNRFLSKHTRQMDGWPVPKALQGSAP